MIKIRAFFGSDLDLESRKEREEEEEEEARPFRLGTYVEESLVAFSASSLINRWSSS